MIGVIARPVLGTATVLLSSAVTEIVSSQIKKRKNALSEPVQEDLSPVQPDVEQVREIKFAVSIASYMMAIDGECHVKERDAIGKILVEQTAGNNALKEELQQIVEMTPTFEDLRTMYKALPMENANVRSQKWFEKVLNDVAVADDHVKPFEMCFLYKCKMEIFNPSVGSVPMFIVLDGQQKPEGPINEIINFVSRSDAEKRGIMHPDINRIYIPHPSCPDGNGQLILIEDFYRCDWFGDKNTEILEAVRILGAKKVIIENECRTKQSAESSSTTGVSGEGSGKGVNVKANANVKLSSMDKNAILEGARIQVEFSGGYLKEAKRRFLGNSAEVDRFLRKSTYVVADPSLKWIVDAMRSGDNQIKNFDRVINYEGLVEYDRRVEVLAGCDIKSVVGNGGAIKAAVENARRLRDFEISSRRIYVEF